MRKKDKFQVIFSGSLDLNFCMRNPVLTTILFANNFMKFRKNNAISTFIKVNMKNSHYIFATYLGKRSKANRVRVINTTTDFQYLSSIIQINKHFVEILEIRQSNSAALVNIFLEQVQNFWIYYLSNGDCTNLIDELKSEQKSIWRNSQWIF